MHYGEYEGAAAATQQRKVLILGESHYSQDPAVKQGTPGNRGTCCVVEDYLADKEGRDRQLTKFFHNIVLAFGINADKDGEKALFWDKVFFGNYIDVLCGVGDNTAKRLADANRDCYNQKLAEYVNQHQINTIFCFSILSYWHLPVSGGHRDGVFPDAQGGKLEQIPVNEKGKRTVYLRGYICQPMSGLFNHPVRIYGLPHPSRAFSAKLFVKYLKPVFEDCCG